ncbi:MAG: leucyl/phenylalanyl-tRNA--protein transferase [Acidimicrobiia bacterium]|nr:leucyl/phenylalanyl-tRNA--protein transferase [Acidimicrobiia bacterium]
MDGRSPCVEPEPSRFAMPDASVADAGADLIAVGADLAPGTLLAAYRAGLFPMPVEPRKRRSQIAWYSPDPRAIIPLDGFHAGRSLRRAVPRFECSFNRSFGAVVRACGEPDRDGFWISDAVIAAYEELFELGWAESVEVWLGDDLVGGVYGVRIGQFFAGESMFHLATDASKVALLHLVQGLRAEGVQLFDVQWLTPHLASLGAVEVTRARYFELLHSCG